MELKQPRYEQPRLRLFDPDRLGESDEQWLTRVLLAERLRRGIAPDGTLPREVTNG